MYTECISSLENCFVGIRFIDFLVCLFVVVVIVVVADHSNL